MTTSTYAERAVYREDPPPKGPNRAARMVTRSIPERHPIVRRMPLGKLMAFVGGLVLGMLSYPRPCRAGSGGDTVQGLYDALLSTMKSGRILGQSGRLMQLEPIIRRSFDIASMARLAVGPSWANLRRRSASK